MAPVRLYPVLAPLAALLVGACAQEVTVSPQDPKQPVTMLVAGDSVRLVASDDPSLTPEMRRSVASAEAKAPVMKRHKDWDSPPAYLVLDTPLPTGVIAQAIRDPSASPHRLVVVSAASIADDALYLGASRLFQDEMRVETPVERRVISVYADDTYTIEEGGRMVYQGRFFRGNEKGHPRGKKGRDAERILSLVRDVAPGTIAGLVGRLYKPARP